MSGRYRDPEYMKNYRKNNINKYREYHKKSNLSINYNLSPEQYNTMFLSQNGKCHICGCDQSEFKRSLAVDHDHLTGLIRKLLCDRCNTGIGYFGDSPELLIGAAKYLEKYQRGVGNVC